MEPGKLRPASCFSWILGAPVGSRYIGRRNGSGKQIEAHTTIRKKVSARVGLPISEACEQVMACNHMVSSCQDAGYFEAAQNYSDRSAIIGSIEAAL
jgi:hypothetical protein